jgi:hypothetical protein
MSRAWYLPLEDDRAWNDALEGVPHSYAHTRSYCHAMHLTTGYDSYLFVYERDGLRVVCPFAERTYEGFTDIVTPGGISGFTGAAGCPEVQELWAAFVGDRGYVCGYIAQNPHFEDPSHFPARHAASSNSLYHLDLTEGVEKLYDCVDRNRKRQLRAWKQSGEELIHDRLALKDFIVEHHAAFMRSVGASPSNFLSRPTLGALCDDDRVLLVGAGEGGRIESVYAFGYTDHLGDCLISISLPEGRRWVTPLLWWGVETLAALGVPRLNLGGGVREGDAIAQAKQRFGAHRKPFRVLREVYRPDVYDQLCRRAGKDPESRAGFFPPYRAPGESATSASVAP